jgi:hypothetical protein
MLIFILVMVGYMVGYAISRFVLYTFYQLDEEDHEIFVSFFWPITWPVIILIDSLKVFDRLIVRASEKFKDWSSKKCIEYVCPSNKWTKVVSEKKDCYVYRDTKYLDINVSLACVYSGKELNEKVSEPMKDYTHICFDKEVDVWACPDKDVILKVKNN